MKQTLKLASLLGSLSLLAGTVLAQSTPPSSSSNSNSSSSRNSTPPTATSPSSSTNSQIRTSTNASTATDPNGMVTSHDASSFASRDTDGDGRISRSEFTMNSSAGVQQDTSVSSNTEKAEKKHWWQKKSDNDSQLKARTNTVEAFNDLDTDKDGFLSASELAAQTDARATGTQR